MKTTIKKFAAMILALVLALSCTGSTSRTILIQSDSKNGTTIQLSFPSEDPEKVTTPEDTIWNIQYAVEHCDAELFLDCFDEEISGKIRPLLSSGEEGKISLKSVLNLTKKAIPLLELLPDGTIPTDQLPKVSFKIQETKIINDKVCVYISVEIDRSVSKTCLETGVRMRFDGDNWVICGIA